jgi:sugar phosphate permease
MKNLKVTLLFSLTYMFYYFTRYNYPVALPFIKEELALNAAQIGVIATALTLGYAIGQLVNGVLVDRKGPRLMMTLGGLGSMVANTVMGGSTFYTMLVLGWLINGYFQSMGYPSSLRLIANWFDKSERGKQVGASEFAQSVASVLILPLAGWLAGSFHWRLVFVVPGLLMGAATAWYYASVRDYPEIIRIAPLSPPLLKDMLARYRAALGDWRLVSANLSYGLCQFVRYAMITWIPSFMYDVTGDDIFTAAIKGAAFQIGGALGSLFVGWLSDLPFLRQRRWVVIALCMVGSAAAATAVGLAPAGVWTMVALALCGMGIESIEVAYFLLPSDFLGDEMTATGVGCMNATGKAVASAQGVALGSIIDAFGYGAAFATAGCFGLLAAALVLPVGLRKQ